MVVIVYEARNEPIKELVHKKKKKERDAL